MGYRIFLPKDKKQVETITKRLIEEGTARRNTQQCRWWISHWYMRGARDFTNINYRDGTVQVGYMNDSGTLNFQYEGILSKYQTQQGRLQGIDLSPRVSRTGIGLDGLRKSSIAQIVLSSAFPEEKVMRLKNALWPVLLHYGTVGLVLWAEDSDSMGIEVVPPWELLPIPFDVADASGVKGIMRNRWVPIDWVQKLKITPNKTAKLYKEAESAEMPVGIMPSAADSKFQNTLNIDMAGGTSTPMGKNDKTKVAVTQLTEMWTMTSDNYLAEYLVFVGGKLSYRIDVSGHKKHMPIHIAYDIQTGGFWGRSFVEMLIPVNTENEYALAQLYQNVQNWDLFGIMYEPTSSGVPQEIFRGADGLKRVRYEPDYVVPDAKPYNIKPTNSGMAPINAMKLGLELEDRLANQPSEMMSGDAPGRVDSSAGLGFLYEVSGVPLSPIAKSVSAAVAGCYRAMLNLIESTWTADKVVDITHLDDSLAGVQLDPQTGEVKLADNAIPMPDEVSITVASEMPRSKEQEKRELKEALKDQIITLTEYNIQVRKKGLDLPVGNEAEWQNYRRAMLENLVLFGDGKTPGKIIHSDYDNHPLHLQVLDAFMARPEYYLADEGVRKVFVAHRHAHLEAMGQLPDDMPYSEDAAEEAMAAEGGGGMPQGMPQGMPPGMEQMQGGGEAPLM